MIKTQLKLTTEESESLTAFRPVIVFSQAFYKQIRTDHKWWTSAIKAEQNENFHLICMNKL